MDNNQTNQKNDQPSKPIVVDDAAKKAETAKPANDTTAKPADAAKTGTA